MVHRTCVRRAITILAFLFRYASPFSSSSLYRPPPRHCHSTVPSSCSHQRSPFLHNNNNIIHRNILFAFSATRNPSRNSRNNPHNTTTTASPLSRQKSYFSASSTRNQIKDMFRHAKSLERQGRWQQAILIFNTILSDWDPKDSYSYLALAKLQARRGGDARRVFEKGTRLCPTSIHLWQAWAVYEQEERNVEKARDLFQKALELDAHNPYVCHAYGLLERRTGNNNAKAKKLWKQGLQQSCSAALVCSLGELLIAERAFEEARDLYETRVGSLKTEREQIEVYLALAWLEERYFSDLDRAEELIETALIISPSSSLAQVAKARLEGRRSNQSTDDASRLALARACLRLESNSKADQHEDGRVYNAWARLEVKANRLDKARDILRKGVERYPRDHLLLQAAGKVEERLGNFSGAKDLYSASLKVEPCAATLVAFALLDFNHPQEGQPMDFSVTQKLFEEAILIDKRHGPVYNAYARAVYRRLKDKDEARRIYNDGLKANCTDSASIYHGYAQFELSLGNVERAHELLVDGVQEMRRTNVGTDAPNRSRALFLIHTLGMLQLNRDQPGTSLNTFNEGMELLGTNSSQLLLGAALSESKLGNEEKARALFERAALDDETHAQAWHAWAVMEMRAGNTETAAQLFECGIKRAPHYGPLWQAYGVLESRHPDKDRARELFSKGLEKAPRHVSLYQSWASLELQQENYDEAKALIGQALTLNKWNGSGWLIAAEVERRLGNRGLGILLLRRGIECCSANPHLYRALGDSLVMVQKFDEAREVFEKGIEKDPQFPHLYHSLAELEARLGNVAALAALHKRTARVFNTTTGSMVGADSFGQFHLTKPRSGGGRKSAPVPKSVSLLAQRIVDSGAEEDEFDNSSYMLERIMNPSAASIDDDLLTDAILQGNSTAQS